MVRSRVGQGLKIFRCRARKSHGQVFGDEILAGICLLVIDKRFVGGVPFKEEVAGAVIAINQCCHCVNKSDHVTLVTPNCQPVVNAVNLIKAGRYSSNLRLQSLLSSVNRSNVYFFTTVPDQDYASSMFMLAGSGRAVGP